eukprot:TRINITY_DN1352_c0_g2_i1.p1 TRINITY_DN1352_c0_g2~~TRINITY_DN1352_c0_g2_i1.p1  ORF type:complete len:967 (+),score=376.99 TRINITY_DN1352_c0_g2_i1:156-3056(+)
MLDAAADKACAALFTRFAFDGFKDDVAPAPAAPHPPCSSAAAESFEESYGASDDDGVDAGIGGLDTTILTYISPTRIAAPAAAVGHPRSPDALFTRFAFDAPPPVCPSTQLNNAGQAAADASVRTVAELERFHRSAYEKAGAALPAAPAPFLAMDVEDSGDDGDYDMEGEGEGIGGLDSNILSYVAAKPAAAAAPGPEAEAAPAALFTRFAFDGGAAAPPPREEEEEEEPFVFARFAFDGAAAAGALEAAPPVPEPEAAPALFTRFAFEEGAAPPAEAEEPPPLFSRFAFDTADDVAMDPAPPPRRPPTPNRLPSTASLSTADVDNSSLFVRFGFGGAAGFDGDGDVAAGDAPARSGRRTAPPPPARSPQSPPTHVDPASLFTRFAFQVDDEPAPPLEAVPAAAGGAAVSPGGAPRPGSACSDSQSGSLEECLPEPLVGARTPVVGSEQTPAGVSPTHSPVQRALDLSARAGSPLLAQELSERCERVKKQLVEQVASGPLPPHQTVPNVQPWAAALLHHGEYGGGGVDAVSDTVFLAEKLVLKATNRLEAELLARLSTKTDDLRIAKVPTLFAQYPASAVFATPPAGCNTAIVYHKVKGHVASDLAAALMRKYIQADGDPAYLQELKGVLNLAAAATVDLYNNGIVHQDLWLGNLVVSNVDPDARQFDGAEISFIDVGDCAAAGAEAFSAALGGLAVSTLGILLGVLMHDVPAAFTPKVLWGDMCPPWWVHTHWVPPQVVSDKKKVALAEAVLHMLLSLDHMQPVMQAGLVAHVERFLGPRHPVAQGAQRTLPGKFKYVSVKRAALAAGLATKENLAHAMLSVRGGGFWTLLRQELGKSLADELHRAVTKKVQPLVNATRPLILTPATPPMRICTGFLPKSVNNHVRKPTDSHPKELSLDARDDTEVSPASLGRTREMVQCDQISNFVTVEQMLLCGEVSEESSVKIKKWGECYGMAFEFEDFSEI